MIEIKIFDDFSYRTKRENGEIKQAIENYKNRILKSTKKYSIDIKIECGISKGFHIDGLVFCNKKKYSIRCIDISKFIYYIHRCIADDIHIVEENRPKRDVVHVYDCTYRPSIRRVLMRFKTMLCLLLV